MHVCIRQCDCESYTSSTEQEIFSADNSDSTEESYYSSEQEEDSAEEVSETERYQKHSEQQREDEYPHSHIEKPAEMAEENPVAFFQKRNTKCMKVNVNLEKR